MDLIQQAAMLNENKERLIKALSSFHFEIQGDQIVESIAYEPEKLEDFQYDLNLLFGLSYVLAEKASHLSNEEYKNHIPETATNEDEVEAVTSKSLLLHKLMTSGAAVLDMIGANATTVQLPTSIDDPQGAKFVSLRVMTRVELEQARDSLQRKVFGNRGVRRLGGKAGRKR